MTRLFAALLPLLLLLAACGGDEQETTTEDGETEEVVADDEETGGEAPEAPEPPQPTPASTPTPAASAEGLQSQDDGGVGGLMQADDGAEPGGTCDVAPALLAAQMTLEDTDPDTPFPVVDTAVVGFQAAVAQLVGVTAEGTETGDLARAVQADLAVVVPYLQANDYDFNTLDDAPADIAEANERLDDNAPALVDVVEQDCPGAGGVAQAPSGDEPAWCATIAALPALLADQPAPGAETQERFTEVIEVLDVALDQATDQPFAAILEAQRYFIEADRILAAYDYDTDDLQAGEELEALSAESAQDLEEFGIVVGLNCPALEGAFQ